MTNKNTGKLPFSCERGFVQVPAVIYQHYQYYPEFNGITAALYATILRYYNADYGYAFPTQRQLRMDLGLSEGAVAKHSAVLERVGLVLRRKSGGIGANYQYTPLKPVEDAKAFYEAFPEALEKFVKHAEKVGERGALHDARLDELQAQDIAQEDHSDIDGGEMNSEGHSVDVPWL